MIHKYKYLILIIILNLGTTVLWGQAPQAILNKSTNLQTDTVAVTDTLDYDRATLLIEWLNKSIVLSEKQKKVIKSKGKKIKEIFKNKGTRTNKIMKQLQTEYKVALDSILTSAQQEQLAPQFNSSGAGLKIKSNTVKQ